MNAVPPHLTRAVKPDVAAQENGAAFSEIDPENALVPISP
jgi:hypothetical protein